MLLSYTTRSRGNEAYLLRMDYGSVPVYCHMTSSDIGACGGGGWSLAMKIDGENVIYLLQMAIGFHCQEQIVINYIKETYLCDRKIKKKIHFQLFLKVGKTNTTRLVENKLLFH